MDSLRSEPIDIEAKKDLDILQLAIKRAESANTYWNDNYDESKGDVRFIFGEQWDEEAVKERELTKRPCLTLNKMPQFINRLIGSQKQNNQTIKLYPINGYAEAKVASQAGSKDYPMSKIIEGLISNIESTSNAQQHYKSAFQHSVEGGFGWLRVLTEYSNDDTFNLDLKIEHIVNRWSVLIDPSFKEPDASDMNYCFIFDKIHKDEFKKRYPKATIGDISSSNDESNSWQNEDYYKIAEYFVRVPKKENLLLMSDGNVYEESTAKDVLDELRQKGITVIRPRTVTRYEVKWYKITAQSILEKGVWDGQTIPVAPVWGRQTDLPDRRYFKGLINEAKDAQRMQNYWNTTATEKVALSPKAPYIGTVQMFEGHERVWENANNANYSYLPYNRQPDGSRPMRESPAPMPSAELQMASMMTDEIKSTIGIYDASLGARSNETSGRAIIARQREADTGTYVFLDNLNMAIARIGEILVEMIPKIYDTERIVRVRFPDGTGDFVKINEEIVDTQTGKVALLNDISFGKYDVSIATGPNYATKRLEAAANLLDCTKAVPQVAQVAPDLIAKSMDFEDIEEVTERLRKTLPPEMLSPEEKEEISKNMPPPPPPSPEQQLEMQKVQMSLQTEQLKLKQQELKTQEQGLKLEEQKLKLEEQSNQDEDRIEDLVARSIAKYMANK